jgi:hypothetical protein
MLRNDLLVLIVLLVLTVVTIQWRNSLVTEEMFFLELMKSFDEEKALRLLESRTSSSIWISYTINATFTLVRLLFVAFLFSASCYLFYVQVSFSKLFEIVVISDFIHLIPVVLKVTWFTVIEPNYAMQDLYQFPRFSVVDLFYLFVTIDDPLLVTVLSQLHSFNIFEGMFCFSVAYLLAQRQHIELSKSTKSIFSAYGLGLTIKAVLIAYLAVVFLSL